MLVSKWQTIVLGDPSYLLLYAERCLGENRSYYRRSRGCNRLVAKLSVDCRYILSLAWAYLVSTNSVTADETTYILMRGFSLNTFVPAKIGRCVIRLRKQININRNIRCCCVCLDMETYLK